MYKVMKVMMKAKTSCVCVFVCVLTDTHFNEIQNVHHLMSLTPEDTDR